MLELSDCRLLSSILCGLCSYSTDSFESLQIDVLQNRGEGLTLIFWRVHHHHGRNGFNVFTFPKNIGMKRFVRRKILSFDS